MGDGKKSMYFAQKRGIAHWRVECPICRIPGCPAAQTAIPGLLAADNSDVEHVVSWVKIPESAMYLPLNPPADLPLRQRNA